jgi:multidrug efflux system membrane fusion protein
MKKSHLIAIIMTAIIVIWMGSGLLASPEQGDKDASQQKPSSPSMLVQVEVKTAQLISLDLTIQGQVEPNRQVTVRSDIKSRVIELLADEGDFLEAGGVIAKLDIEDREIRLERQKALLKSRQESYRRTETLSQSSLQSQSMLEESFAALKAAEADLAQLEFEITRLSVRAPFSGTIERRLVEEGSYVGENAEIVSFVDNRKLKVIAPVAQRDIQKVTLGETAIVELATQQTREGKVTYISPVANQSTRTFRVEIELDNENAESPAGISAEIKIPTQKVNAHFVSPSILTLDSDGNIGIKTVDDANQVVFHTIDIVKSETAGLYVTGLPESARVITVGQGFVEAGATVDIYDGGEATE